MAVGLPELSDDVMANGGVFVAVPPKIYCPFTCELAVVRRLPISALTWDARADKPLTPVAPLIPCWVIDDACVTIDWMLFSAETLVLSVLVALLMVVR